MTDEQLQALQTFLAEIGLPENRSLDTMARLYYDLVAANKLTNLTRITDEADFYFRHVADSLAVLSICPELLAEDAPTVADVGCGGGFPILPLAWANPSLRICGIECRPKKTAFIAEEIRRLDFPFASVETAQVREAARGEHGGIYDVVVLRAVAESGKFLREVRGLLKSDAPGKIINYKTPSAVDIERAVTAREAKKFGFNVIETSPFELPLGMGTRCFVILEK
jgi:16S rRNA (guanine527-N7)-methyltransferase